MAKQGQGGRWHADLLLRHGGHYQSAARSWAIESAPFHQHPRQTTMRAACFRLEDKAIISINVGSIISSKSGQAVRSKHTPVVRQNTLLVESLPLFLIAFGLRGYVGFERSSTHGRFFLGAVGTLDRPIDPASLWSRTDRSSARTIEDTRPGTCAGKSSVSRVS
jgi:hypothetical protein